MRDAMPDPLLEIFRRDAGQSEASDAVAGGLPGIARNPEHRRFAGAGVADDDAEIPCFGDMLERIALLGGEGHTA